MCIDLQNCEYDREPLYKNKIKIIPIKNRKDTSWISQLGKLANDIEPDVIFCHGFNGPIIVKVASLFYQSLRKPMICTYHGMYNAPTKNKEPIANLINKLQAWIYKKYAKTVIIVAQYSGIFLAEQGVPNSKMTVVYNGISTNLPTTKAINLNYEGISIGLAARITAIKGIEYLLEAIKLLKQMTNKKFHLYVVGDGPLLEDQKRQIKELKIEDAVSYIGYSDKIAEWLNAWDIFCLPSLQENHSIALLEAMRAGKAIVCTSVGGNPETVKDEVEALLVPACNSQKLANALKRLIESEDLRKKLGINAYQKFTNNFTEEIMKKRLCEVLKNAIKH